MAHKKGQGSTVNGRDSNGQRRGVKTYGGERVTAGSIIIRQTGTHIKPGRYVGEGKDHTLYALKPGLVKFEGPQSRRRVTILLDAQDKKPEAAAARG